HRGAADGVRRDHAAGHLRVQDRVDRTRPDDRRRPAGDRPPARLRPQVREARNRDADGHVRVAGHPEARGRGPGTLMKRRVAAAAAGLAVLTLATLAPAATKPTSTPGRITLTEATVSQFPVKAFSLGLPTKKRLDVSQLTVLENGKPVNDLQLQTPG